MGLPAASCRNARSSGTSRQPTEMPSPEPRLSPPVHTVSTRMATVSCSTGGETVSASSMLVLHVTEPFNTCCSQLADVGNAYRFVLRIFTDLKISPASPPTATRSLVGRLIPRSTAPCSDISRCVLKRLKVAQWLTVDIVKDYEHLCHLAFPKEP